MLPWEIPSCPAPCVHKFICGALAGAVLLPMEREPTVTVSRAYPVNARCSHICHYLLGWCFTITFFLRCFAEGIQGTLSVDSFGRWEAEREGKAEKKPPKLAVEKKKVKKDHFSLQNTVVVLRFLEGESISQQKGGCVSGGEGRIGCGWRKDFELSGIIRR